MKIKELIKLEPDTVISTQSPVRSNRGRPVQVYERKSELFWRARCGRCGFEIDVPEKDSKQQFSCGCPGRTVTPYQTRRQVRAESYRGTFQIWGSEVVEDEGGIGTATTAIIEKPDGSIGCEIPTNIKFLDVANDENLDKESR